MNIAIKFKCVICGKEFLKRSEGIKRNSKRIMGYNRITCSKRCSHMNVNLQRKFRQMYLKEISKLKRKIRRLEKNGK